jgi:hypothetical protein
MPNNDDSTFYDHPAWDAPLMEALRQSTEGGGAAEALEIVFTNAPPFQLEHRPNDEWDYLHTLVLTFAENAELAERSFENEAHALMVGQEIGFALGVRRSRLRAIEPGHSPYA